MQPVCVRSMITASLKMQLSAVIDLAVVLPRTVVQFSCKGALFEIIAQLASLSIALFSIISDSTYITCHLTCTQMLFCILICNH
jgi:hypothetical protein